MRLRVLTGLSVVLAVTALPLFAAEKAYSVKTVDKMPAPKEVQEPIRKLLGERRVQLLNAKGDLLAEVWFRKDLPAKATEAQIKNGLTYTRDSRIDHLRRHPLPQAIHRLPQAKDPRWRLHAAAGQSADGRRSHGHRAVQ